MLKLSLSLVLEVLGAVALVVGAAMIFLPAAFVVTGLLLILFAQAADA